MLVVIICLILPILFYKFIKNHFIGYFVSAFTVSAVLLGYMVYLELNASDFDMDIIFHLGLMLWMLVVFIYCGVVFTVMSYIERK
jgi:hypothetical protein